MEIRRDIGYALGSMLIAGLVISMVSIGLFARMTPAIERIRKDNVVTLDAARDLLEVLAEVGGGTLELTHRERIEVALDAMRNNLTVDGEGKLVAAVTDAVAIVLAGEASAVPRVIAAIDALTLANARAMEEADREAQRLGEAGAWTAAIGGIALVLLGLFARARLERRLVRPVLELTRVLEWVRGGDGLARCRGLRGTAELERALKQVNRLLDRATMPEARVNGKAREDHHAAALVALLARREGPWVVVSVKDGLVAANDAAQERLAAEDGPLLIVLARDAISKGQVDGLETLEVLEERALGLVRLPLTASGSTREASAVSEEAST